MKCTIHVHICRFTELSSEAVRRVFTHAFVFFFTAAGAAGLLRTFGDALGVAALGDALADDLGAATLTTWQPFTYI